MSRSFSTNGGRGAGGGQPVRLGDLGSAQVVWAVARSRKRPSDATCEALEPAWLEAVEMAHQDGAVGVQKWMAAMQTRLDPDRYAEIVEAIVRSEAMPAPSDGPEINPLPPDEDVITQCLADVQPVEIVWLWPNRIPIAKLTLVAGEAKQGKSFLTMDIAARVSAGLPIPCGDGECMPVGSVVILSAEDDLGDTIRPRLDALGADCTKIHALNTIRTADGRFGPFTLHYIPHLERAIDRAGDCKLVIIDPVTHYVGGGIDDHKNTQIRHLLEPLRDLAVRRQVAVVMVSHLNKGNGTKALNRVTGSGAYTALARANWLVCKDKDNPKRRLFLSAGTNLVEDPPGLAYRINREAKRLEWEDELIEMDADEALAALSEPKTVRDHQGNLDLAREWLLGCFTAGERILSETILNQGKDAGFKRDILFEAKKDLKIQSVRHPEDTGAWSWLPPPGMTSLPPVDSVGPLEEGEAP